MAFMGQDITQANKILDILSDNKWHCVTEFIDIYCVDYRRRLCDLKVKGHELVSMKCGLHQHKSGVKMWKLNQRHTFTVTLQEAERRVQTWANQFKPKETKQQQLNF